MLHTFQPKVSLFILGLLELILIGIAVFY